MPIGTFSIKSTNGLELSAINPENLYLYRIALLPDFQGKGLGRQITHFACEYARKFNKILYSSISLYIHNTFLISKAIAYDIMDLEIM